MLPPGELKEAVVGGAAVAPLPQPSPSGPVACPVPAIPKVNHINTP